MTDKIVKTLPKVLSIIMPIFHHLPFLRFNVVLSLLASALK